jgi:hypothetical protein
MSTHQFKHVATLKHVNLFPEVKTVDMSRPEVIWAISRTELRGLADGTELLVASNHGPIAGQAQFALALARAGISQDMMMRAWYYYSQGR